MEHSLLDIQHEVAAALAKSGPVVALESSLIAQGLPWPDNRATALRMEGAVRALGAVPATIALLDGRSRIGLDELALEELARPGGAVLKLSRRDLAAALGGKRPGATTVAGTMALAHLGGIRLLATGGIGGVHRGNAADVSADLYELARTPVAVVCSGAKSILDIPRTLEMLETLGVPVVGFATDYFPAFCVRSSGCPVPTRVDTPEQAAALLATHWQLKGAGVVLAQPVPETAALGPQEFEAAVQIAEERALQQSITGPALTPFLLRQVAEITRGKSVRANIELAVANASLAARVAVAWAKGLQIP